MPLLQEDDRVDRVIGIARRAFDPAERGWTKMEYRRGDVRDADALRTSFDGAEVVVHLAFLILSGGRETTRAINVEGTLNAFRAAAEVGVKRFVYASSVAAYGFHRDNPIGISEDWATRPADRLFYAQEKAELEHLLQQEAAARPQTALYLLRPPIVLGPDAVGAKVSIPTVLAPLARAVGAARWRLPG
jgi:nucleoside-diphosphate-sugar epimerase